MQVIIFQKELYAYPLDDQEKNMYLSSHRATRELYAKVPSHELSGRSSMRRPYAHRAPIYTAHLVTDMRAANIARGLIWPWLNFPRKWTEWLRIILYRQRLHRIIWEFPVTEMLIPNTRWSISIGASLHLQEINGNVPFIGSLAELIPDWNDGTRVEGISQQTCCEMGDSTLNLGFGWMLDVQTIQQTWDMSI